MSAASVDVRFPSLSRFSNSPCLQLPPFPTSEFYTHIAGNFRRLNCMVAVYSWTRSCPQGCICAHWIMVARGKAMWPRYQWVSSTTSDFAVANCRLFVDTPYVLRGSLCHFAGLAKAFGRIPWHELSNQSKRAGPCHCLLLCAYGVSLLAGVSSHQ